MAFCVWHGLFDKIKDTKIIEKCRSRNSFCGSNTFFHHFGNVAYNVTATIYIFSIFVWQPFLLLPSLAEWTLPAETQGKKGITLLRAGYEQSEMMHSLKDAHARSEKCRSKMCSFLRYTGFKFHTAWPTLFSCDPFLVSRGGIGFVKGARVVVRSRVCNHLGVLPIKTLLLLRDQYGIKS